MVEGSGNCQMWTAPGHMEQAVGAQRTISGMVLEQAGADFLGDDEEVFAL